MFDLHRTYRNATAAPILSAGHSAGSSVQEDRPVGIPESLYPIDQKPLESGATNDDSTFILWGDVFIESRHPMRIARTA